MPIPIRGIQIIITPDRVKKIKREFEESMYRTWLSLVPMAPKMDLNFRVNFNEIYASTVGQIIIFTPIWRGKVFSDAILSHEFLHWVIHPKDIYRALKELFITRQLLAQELKYNPKIVKTDLFGKQEDWSSFEYQANELQFVQNMMGDYLINWHIHDYYPNQWNELWSFLFHDGSFYEAQKKLKRDTTFMIYLAAYNYLINGLDQVNLKDPQATQDSVQVAHIIRELREKRMSGSYALKELAKIFHKYIQKDGCNCDGGDVKCPKCGYDEFDVIGYEDPQSGKWIDVKPKKGKKP